MQLRRPLTAIMSRRCLLQQPEHPIFHSSRTPWKALPPRALTGTSSYVSLAQSESGGQTWALHRGHYLAIRATMPNEVRNVSLMKPAYQGCSGQPPSSQVPPSAPRGLGQIQCLCRMLAKGLGVRSPRRLPPPAGFLGCCQAGGLCPLEVVGLVGPV